MSRRAGKLLLVTILAVMTAHAGDAPLELQKLVTITTLAHIDTVSLCGTSGLAAGLAHGGAVSVWRVPSGEMVSSRAADGRISSLACSPDGKWMALGNANGSVAISEVAGKASKTLAVTDRSITSLMFSPDGSLLAVSPHEAPVQLWNVATGEWIATLQTEFSGTISTDFSPDSSWFATADADTRIRIYDRNGKLRAKYTDLLLEPFAISFTADGKQVIFGGADCILTFLDASSGQVVRHWPKQADPIFMVAALPNGVSLLSLQIDAETLGKFTTTVWDIPSGKARKLAIDGSHIVGGGNGAGGKPLLFTADSDTALTAWAVPN